MKTRLHELLSRHDEDDIIESEILGMVVDAARKKLIGTQLLSMRIGPTSIPGDSITVPKQTLDSITVRTVAEGAEIPIEVEAYSTITLRPVKYGLRPLITREMVEDAKFDVVQRNLEYASYKMAEKLDSLILAQIEAGSDANSTTHMVTGGAGITVRNITDAMLNIESDGYTPTDLILGPEPASDIRNLDTFVEADKAGVTDPSQRLIGRIFGMNVWVSRNVNNVEYAYLIDRDWALVLAEKRPLTIERYTDVPRDLVGMTLTARWHARYLVEEACAHIELS